MIRIIVYPYIELLRSYTYQRVKREIIEQNMILISYDVDSNISTIYVYELYKYILDNYFYAYIYA